MTTAVTIFQFCCIRKKLQHWNKQRWTKTYTSSATAIFSYAFHEQ